MIPLKNRADQIRDEMIEIRRRIHTYPESAFEEYRTTELLRSALESYGLTIDEIGCETGVTAVLHGAFPGKCIALRADIDCLNMDEQSGLSFSSAIAGKCHACGHDIHATALLACARLLSEYREHLHGTVKFIFQPAEEGTRGARKIIGNGVLSNPKVDAIFGIHCWPDIPQGTIGYRKGTMMAASDRFTITISADGGHAAHPYRTADPIVIGAHIITQLQTIVSREVPAFESAVVTVGKLHAGTAANIIPSTAILEGTVRCFSKEMRARIGESIERIATLTAQAMKASASVSFTAGPPAVINDRDMTDHVIKAAQMILGAERVIELPTPSMGGEDFAFYLEHVPGSFFRIGTANDSPSSKLALHNPRIVFDEGAIMTGALTLVGAAFLSTGSDLNEILG